MPGTYYTFRLLYLAQGLPHTSGPLECVPSHVCTMFVILFSLCYSLGAVCVCVYVKIMEGSHTNTYTLFLRHVCQVNPIVNEIYQMFGGLEFMISNQRLFFLYHSFKL